MPGRVSSPLDCYAVTTGIMSSFVDTWLPPLSALPTQYDSIDLLRNKTQAFSPQLQPKRGNYQISGEQFWKKVAWGFLIEYRR